MSNFLGTVELTKDFSSAGIHLSRDEQPRPVVVSSRLRASANGRTQIKHENGCTRFRLVRNESFFFREDIQRSTIGGRNVCSISN